MSSVDDNPCPRRTQYGDFDRLAERRTVYEQLGTRNKVFLDVACASHFIIWERRHEVLHTASLEWLQKATVQNVSRGEFRVSETGQYAPK